MSHAGWVGVKQEAATAVELDGRQRRRYHVRGVITGVAGGENGGYCSSRTAQQAVRSTAGRAPGARPRRPKARTLCIGACATPHPRGPHPWRAPGARPL